MSMHLRSTCLLSLGSVPACVLLITQSWDLSRGVFECQGLHEMELSWVIFPGYSCLKAYFLKCFPFGNGLCSSLSGEMFAVRKEIEKDGFPRKCLSL